MKPKKNPTTRTQKTFEYIFENIIDGIIIVNAESKKFSLGNRAICRMLGYTKEELLNISVQNIHPKETLPYIEKLFNQLLNKEIELAKDIPTRKKDGSMFYADIAASPIHYKGKPHLVATFRNITDRKEAEMQKDSAIEALHKNEERMRAIIDHSPFGAHSYELFPDGKLILTGTNKAADVILGINHSSLLGKTIEEAFPPLAQTDIPGRYRKVALDGTGFHDYQNNYSDGKIQGAYEIYAFQIQQNRMSVFFLDITERKRSEEALQESEYKYRRIVDTSNEGIMMVNNESHVDFVNNRILTMLGYQHEEIMGLPYRSFIFNEDIPEYEERITQRMTGVADRYECRLRRKDGNPIWTIVSATPILDSQNRFIGSFAMFTDITERKLAEETVIKSEEKYRTLVNNMQDAVYRSDLNGNIIFTTLSAARLLGCPSVDSMIGLNISKDFYYYPEDREKMLKALKELGKITQYEVTLKRLDNGNPVIVLTNSQFFKDKDGEIIGVEGVFSDITERKQSQEELRKNETILKSLFDVIPVGIGIMQNRVHIKVNNSLCKIYGYSEKEFLEQGSRFLYTDENEYNRVGMELNAQMIKEGFGVIETRNKRKDGEIIDVLLYLSPFDIKDISAGLVIAVLDITERKKMEAERARLEEMLLHSQKIESIGRLAGGIAHDFNNLLTAILGYTEMAMHQLDPDGKPHSQLSVVIKAAQGAANLTKQLLAFSRKQIIEPKFINLNDSIKHIQKMILTLIGENVKLHILPYDKLFTIKADPGQIEQIIINLAANARDAMPDGGKLIIETSNVYLDENYSNNHTKVLPGDYVMMAITDTGSGMSKETMDQAFEPFFTTKEQGYGTGLGLATVYGIVKQNGGTIEIYSEIGQGTEFKIYFPRSFQTATELPNSQTNSEMPSGTETVLIAEDKIQVLEFSRDVLIELGYKVLTAASGEEALTIAENFKGKIHLFLTDIILTGINGRITAERLKLMRPELKILYNSGYTAEVIDKQGILEQGLNFISKPFSSQELAINVRKVLDKN